MTAMSQSAAAPSDPVDLSTAVIGVLGGTGAQGRGLARRFALAGLKVVIGSRDGARAAAMAAELSESIGKSVTGEDNATCASQADVVVVAVPWEGHAELLATLTEQLSGKIVVDCVNPLGFDKRGAFALVVEDGSAALQAARVLPESRVVGAFHHVSAVLLLDELLDEVPAIDIMVVGDDRAATDTVCALVDRIPGMRAVYAGRLRNSHQVEALTANLISVNRRYKIHAGVQITGLG
jgi:NADPH-dependent F420 reductase